MTAAIVGRWERIGGFAVDSLPILYEERRHSDRREESPHQLWYEDFFCSNKTFFTPHPTKYLEHLSDGKLEILIKKVAANL
jgi:hypothetical protein